MTASRKGEGRAGERRPVLVVGSERLERFSTLPAPYAAEVAAGWEELFARLPDIPPSALVIVDPYANGTEVPAAFWQLLARFPSVAVVAAFEFPLATADEWTRMLDAGVGEFINLERPSPPPVLAELFRSVHARPLKRQVESSLSRFVSGDARLILRAAADVAVSGGAVGELARVFSVSPETLAVWCASASLPTPRRLLLWMRLLLAAQLIGDAGRRIGSAARASGYRSDRSLRRALNRVAGAGARTLRREGMFAAVAAELNGELRRLRVERQRPSPGQPAKVVVPMRSHDTAGCGGVDRAAPS